MAANIFDPNTAPVAQMVTSQIVSSYDYLKPQHIPQLFARYGNQFMPMHLWMKAMGRFLPIQGETLTGWEENRWHRTFKVAGNVGDPGAGNSASVVLHADDLGSAPSYHFYPRVGNIVTIPGTEVQAYIEAITGAGTNTVTLTLTPLNDAKNIGALAQNTVLAITSIGYGHGTDQPNPTTVGMTQREFSTQIFKESLGITGTELTNEKWFQVTNDGRSVDLWYTPGIARAEYYLGMYQDGAFLLGEPNTNSIVVPAGQEGEGGEIPTTKGIIPWMRDLGKVISVGTGTWEIPDLDTAALYLKSQGITSGTILCLTGAKRIAEIENVAKDYLDNNGTDYTYAVDSMFGGSGPDAKAIGAAFDFRVFRKSGFTFIFKSMDYWSDPEFLGASGYNFDEYTLGLPLSMVKDRKTGTVMPNIATYYKERNGYNRAFEVWDIAGAGSGLKVLSVDKKSTFLRSHLMFTLLGANQTFMFDPN